MEMPTRSEKLTTNLYTNHVEPPEILMTRLLTCHRKISKEPRSPQKELVQGYTAVYTLVLTVVE